MGYAAGLRETFPELDPVVEDLFLLEAHEVAELPQRVPARELAAVLHAAPIVRRFLEARHPPIRTELTRVLATHPAVAEDKLPECEAAVVWEIADWIVYQRAPQLYDRRVSIAWDPAVVTSRVEPRDARVIDAGAGTGRVALSVALLAREVFAVEPVAALRRYVRAAAADRDLSGCYVLDGLLHDVPLPPDTADVLVTCHSIGWHLPAELHEIDRLVRSGGLAVHVFDAAMADPGPLGEALIAAGYDYELFPGAVGSLHCYTRWY